MGTMYFSLNNGHKIPALGISIPAPDDRNYETDFGIPLAISEGYRLFDLSDPLLDYRRLGQVLEPFMKDGAIPRTEFYFIVNYHNAAYTSWDHDSLRVRGLIQDLRIEYADLMLVDRSPRWIEQEPELVMNYRLPRDEALSKALRTIRNEKISERVVSIGYNNFDLLQIKKTMERVEFTPNVVKMDVTPYFQEKEARAFCRHHGIAIIGHPSKEPREIPDDEFRLVAIPPILRHPVIFEIARAHTRREGEVIHRWYVDEGMSIVTKMGGLKKLQVLMEVSDYRLTERQLDAFRTLDVQRYSKHYEIILKYQAGRIRIENLEMNNDQVIPQLGITIRHNIKYPPRPGFREGLELALDAGVRHIDCAQKFQKLQKMVGRTVTRYIKEGRFEREDIFIASKVWKTFHSFERCQEAVDQCLEDLQTDYIDLMFIHFPQGTVVDTWDPNLDRGNSHHDYLETYRSLEKCVRDGKVRALGLCNFSLKQIKRVIENSSIKPSVVQDEFAVTYKRHADTLLFCQKHDIVFEAGWPFGQENDSPTHKSSNPGVDDTREMLAMAREMGKTRRQIALAWCISKGAVVLPRSFSQEEIADYIEAFSIELTSEQIDFLDGIPTSFPTWNDGVNDLHHPYWHFKDL